MRHSFVYERNRAKAGMTNKDGSQIAVDLQEKESGKPDALEEVIDECSLFRGVRKKRVSS